MTLPTLEDQQIIIEKIHQARSERQNYMAQIQIRQQRGLEIAKHLAHRLKTEFGVQKVVLFGSLLSSENMTFESDIDLAVWGLPPHLLYRAGATLEAGHDFAVDLVPIERAKPYIQQAIAKGMEL